MVEQAGLSRAILAFSSEFSSNFPAEQLKVRFKNCQSNLIRTKFEIILVDIKRI